MTLAADRSRPDPDPAWQARVDLAAAYRLAARFGFNEAICNHFTLLLPGSRDRFLVIPHGLHWSEVRASDLLLVDTEGRIVEGRGELEATAFYIHARIHLHAAHAACVLHTHQPYASALTLIDGGHLQPVIQSAIRFHGRIAYDSDFQGVVLDSEEGDRLARCLGDKEVLFMANHGVLVVGPTVAQAFDALYYLERACQAQVIAMSTGRPLSPVSDNLARHTHEAIMRDVPHFAALHFAALKRILDREDPEYAS